MKNLLHTVFLIFVCCYSPLFAQGLNFEKGFNNTHHQVATAVVCDGEYTYLVESQSTFGFSTNSTLTKLDTNGIVLWSSIIDPGNVEVVNVQAMEIAEDTSIYVSGWGMQTCDVGGNYHYITKYSVDGEILWNKIWGEDNSYGGNSFDGNSSGFSVLKNGNVAVQRNDHAYYGYPSAHLFVLDAAGNQLDSFFHWEQGFQGFLIVDDGFLTYKNNELWEIDLSSSDAHAYRRKTFTSNIKNVVLFDKKLYVLTEHSLIELNGVLNVNQSLEYDQHQSVSNLKVDTNEVQFILADSLQHSIHTFDLDFNLVANVLLSIPWNEEAKHDFSATHYSRATDFDLWAYHAVRLLDYSLDDATNAVVENTDVELLDLDISNYEINPTIHIPGLYNVVTDAELLIKNTGIQTLKSVLINRRFGFGICNEAVYSRLFSDLELQAGDSTWVSLERYATNMRYPSSLEGDSAVVINLCFYSSHPNGQTDLNVLNDNVCREFSLEYVSNKNVLQHDVVITPIPADDYLSISNLPNRNFNYSIYNSQGKLVRQEKLTEENINITSLPTGVYLLWLESEDRTEIASSKFLKL